MARIVLGITGSIAAYKACDIANILTKEGHEVDVVMTPAATKFITPLTLQTLTKRKVHIDCMSEDNPAVVQHIDLAKHADMVVVAPLSANTLSDLAHGRADSMVTLVCLAARTKPILLCPAMNSDMYANPATQDNLRIVTERGYQYMEPREDMLACGDIGKGAIPKTSDIIKRIDQILLLGV